MIKIRKLKEKFKVKQMHDDSIICEYHEMDIVYYEELLNRLGYIVGVSDRVEFVHMNNYRKVLFNMNGNVFWFHVSEMVIQNYFEIVK